MRLAYVCGDPGVPVWGTKGCSVHVQEVIRALRREACMSSYLPVVSEGNHPQT